MPLWNWECEQDCTGIVYKIKQGTRCGGTATWKREAEDHEFEASLGKVSKTLSQKQNAGSIAKVVEPNARPWSQTPVPQKR
jgi:hypothetical protein